MSSSIRSPQLICSMVVVLLVTAIGIVLELQGWRSKSPAFDMIDFYDGAHNLLTRGIFPQYGDVSSYASFHPPGPAWLMVPGMLVFKDPRLFEKVGSAFLHFGTLLGVFLLARVYLGTWCACLSVLLYGLSWLGLSFAMSLWPIGHPFFYVWTVYLAGQWVIHKDAKYLAAAIVIYAAGMYFAMAIAPVLFVLPALWLLYRPPVHLRPLVIAGVLALAIWYPYLHFEATRGFADLRSQLLLKSIFPANYKDTWCDSSLTLRNLGNISSTPTLDSTTLQTSKNKHNNKMLGLLHLLLKRGRAVVDRLLFNFESVAPVPGTSIVLLLLALSSLVVLSMSGSSIRAVEFIFRHRFWHHWLTPFAVGMILFGVLANEFVIARYMKPDGVLGIPTISTIRWWQAVLVLSGIVLLMRRQIAAVVNQLVIPAGMNIQTAERAEKGRLLVLSLFIPWLILLFVAEPGRPERFLWLWPLQIVVLAAFVTNALSRLKVPRPVAWISQLLLILILVGNPLLSRVDSWLRTGWSGPDAEQVQVVDYVASQLRMERKNRAAIGYQTIIYRFMAAYNIINPEYKVGAEFDLLFKYRHGITNTNRCAEGVSPDDEYRIVQTRPESGVEPPREYFNVPLDGSFHMLRQFGAYQVFKRD